MPSPLRIAFLSNTSKTVWMVVGTYGICRVLWVKYVFSWFIYFLTSFKMLNRSQKGSSRNYEHMICHFLRVECKQACWQNC